MRYTLVTLGTLAVSASCHAGVVWNEAVNGDLSNNRLVPSQVNLSLGVNSVLGSTQGGDEDYLTIHIGPGLQFSQLIGVSYVSNDAKMFIGVQAGTTFTEDPSNANVGNILGYTHFGTGTGNIGHDLLPGMGTAVGAIGFVPPLPSGDYTFWIQQLGLKTDWQLDFVTTNVVPEPASLLGLAAVALLAKRRRK